MRTLSRLLLAIAVPATLTAQDVIPDDWTYRLDGDQAFAAGQEVHAGEWRYTTMPPGWHITTTAQGVTMLPTAPRVLSGEWGVEVELFLFPDPSDAGFGIALEATTGEARAQQLHFLLRRDGQAALLARHAGGDTLLIGWTADTAATPHSGEVDRYVLRLMHQGETLAFSINGREMLAMPTDGSDHGPTAGLRVGPGLNLHVSRFDLITPLAPARRR